MSKKAAIPDAWDDDWVKAADKPDTQQSSQDSIAAKLSKAERRAQHAEQQKQLWDTAENPGRFHWLETQGVVPLKQEFAAPVTLLSRKPPTVAKREDDEDSEEEARKKREASMEERQKKAELERKEKQKRYAEARERIMGTSSPAQASNSRDSSQGRNNQRQRGGNKAGARRSQPDSPAEPSTSATSSSQQLFDPDDMGRRLMTKREASSTLREDMPVRQPRGPESGRGGFGFAGRGGSTAS
ncbi:unnamed protein product [Zymoseptoria tritici ST99CH_1A5]|uniref:SUZ domain-containing protein n=2 Tax=Zymoseptoria tritici TaxID=1047171 RepID=A0A1X7RGD9_ZYMT9|nr:unnamed protein product [Zymoseptoria tritici ST99CH_3D7]SMY20174.1 unnamed protein product [Zymoseptoria tritici ST99CH_1A5]